MRFVRLLLLGILLGSILTLSAQEPYKVTQKFFPPPADIQISTPGCLRAAERQPYAPNFTSYAELQQEMELCMKLQPTWIQQYTIGTSQNGTPIRAWRICNAKEKGAKIKLMYMARVHGDEPSGTEALLFFAKQLCTNTHLQRLLADIDFYLVPMVNVDGAALNTRRGVNKMDLNRDQSLLVSSESHALQSFVHQVQPQVAVDFHEYYASNAKYKILGTDSLALPWDVMTSCTKNLNVPSAIRSISAEKFIPDIETLCRKMEWTHDFYTSSDLEEGRLVFSRGGVYPTTTTAVLPLQNVISFIVETRRTGPHNRSLERRSWIAYTMAAEFARLTAAHAPEIRNALVQAQQDTQKITVRFSSQKEETVEYLFLNMQTAEYQKIPIFLRDIRKARPKIQRSFPKGYYVLPGQDEIKAQLDRQNILYTRLSEAREVSVEAYRLKKYRPGVQAEVEIEAGLRPLPAGTLYVPMQQPKARWITLMMEPEAYHSYLLKNIFPAEEGDCLPYFRAGQTL